MKYISGCWLISMANHEIFENDYCYSKNISMLFNIKEIYPLQFAVEIIKDNITILEIKPLCWKNAAKN
jgi:hypothetical protein